VSTLAVTLVDVGWGDSILIQSTTGAGERHFALVDCNDTTYLRSSYLFVKRCLERQLVDIDALPWVFDFILLTHGHMDHASGIQAMMRDFRTDSFWYPKSVAHGGFAKILSYANQYQSKVKQHQSVDRTKVLPNLGDVRLKLLWPPYTPGGAYDDDNENNNSVVLALTLDQVSFVLTGDCEAENWPQIVDDLAGIPGLAMFKIPHHGAVNGMFDPQDDTPWLDVLPAGVCLAISSHIRPFKHPAPEVVQELASRNIEPFRTDLHYHLTFTTDGSVQAGVPNLEVHWSHS
jgi:beta-lactamase superfamily II metal-dependent hydrolase